MASPLFLGYLKVETPSFSETSLPTGLCTLCHDATVTLCCLLCLLGSYRTDISPFCTELLFSSYLYAGYGKSRDCLRRLHSPIRNYDMFWGLISWSNACLTLRTEMSAEHQAGSKVSWTENLPTFGRETSRLKFFVIFLTPATKIPIRYIKTGYTASFHILRYSPSSHFTPHSSKSVPLTALLCWARCPSTRGEMN